MLAPADNQLGTPPCKKLIDRHYLADEQQVISQLMADADLTRTTRDAISARAVELIGRIRSRHKPGVMENFLVQYGLTTDEGVSLMCLAEALLRVPDTSTIDALIEDKIVSSSWGDYLGQSSSSLINASTWALLVTGKLIAPTHHQLTLRSILKRLGEPVVRAAVAQAIKELGRQFVLGQDIASACTRAKSYESQGYRYSYDMLGESVHTRADAQHNYRAYTDAIAHLATTCANRELHDNPGISVKLSALHPRYEFNQHNRVMRELVPDLLRLAQQAKAANIGFTIDAEEADRLMLSLDVIEAVLSDPSLANWPGFGVVVQAFSQRAAYVLDWLYALCTHCNRRITVRLVKGAYWDSEIKRAQVMGLAGFPVFTRKASSDVSYIACAKKLFTMGERIYPQFATHNAHTVSAILTLAGSASFEFQRLHGMGESLHDTVMSDEKTRCRIYAPVGSHKDLLAYLTRRLLENGANSSFVNQIASPATQAEEIARDPFSLLEQLGANLPSRVIRPPAQLYGERLNSKGWDITHLGQMQHTLHARAAYRATTWQGGPLLADATTSTDKRTIYSPSAPDERVGEVIFASDRDIEAAIVAAERGFADWSALPAKVRCQAIDRVGELLEQHAHELFALISREAGKTLLDGIAELREAVDFARYYAHEGIEKQHIGSARGPIVCISPWNFPLAIFAGQILANLAAGNVVLAKPAEASSLIASRATELMHQAGIPRSALQLLPGEGATVGAALCADARIAGVCFTGSTGSAQNINRAMAANLAPDAPLIAETGGLNAMIVDSTALAEQVVRDVLVSAFQSAGQRCSALRMLYLQSDIADELLEMLFGAMDQLTLGDPWELTTDIGPVIDASAQAKIAAHCQKFAAIGRVLKTLPVPDNGFFVAPTVIRLDGIEQLEAEIFGPVLHIATFEAQQIDQVVDAINAKGYGLTFGLHTRLNRRVEEIASRIEVGNIYVNRNQIGAIVGSQPFGGNGLSGTGPKAGGPFYVPRLIQSEPLADIAPPDGVPVSLDALQSALAQIHTQDWANCTNRLEQLQAFFTLPSVPLDTQPKTLPGPTGEMNLLSYLPRGLVLCLGPDRQSALTQAVQALAQGNGVVVVAADIEAATAAATGAGLPLVAINGQLMPEALLAASGFHAVASAANNQTLRAYRMALAQRDGALLPLITEQQTAERFVIERHLCIDTTAAGGNASLIAASE